jgi:hypothetical protein
MFHLSSFSEPKINLLADIERALCVLFQSRSESSSSDCNIQSPDAESQEEGKLGQHT